MGANPEAGDLSNRRVPVPYKDLNKRRENHARYFRERYASDPDFRANHIASTKRYHENNPAGVAARSANKQAKKLGIAGRISTADVQELWERQPVCLNCGRGRGLDHITAMVNGGANELANLQNLCVVCNQVKNKWALAPGEIERPPFDGDVDTCRRGHVRFGNEYVSHGKRFCKSCHNLAVRQYRTRKSVAA